MDELRGALPAFDRSVDPSRARYAAPRDGPIIMPWAADGAPPVESPARQDAVASADATLECQFECQSCHISKDVCGRQRTERIVVLTDRFGSTTRFSSN
jgi:hypothetical protein